VDEPNGQRVETDLESKFGIVIALDALIISILTENIRLISVFDAVL
jgi:hypothetical protein